MFKDFLKKMIRDELINNNIDERNTIINNDDNIYSSENNSNINNYNENVEDINRSINLNTDNNEENGSVYDNLVKEDKDFSEAAFKAKVDNIFIQLYTAVMKQDLQRVKHFLADEVFEKYDRRVKQLQENNQLQIYDELNVSDTNILNIEETEDEFKVHVSLLTKYLDYLITKDTKKFISGNRDVRTEKRVKLVFTKIKKAKELRTVRTCQSCGANMDINMNGVCPYCGSIYKLKDYDWILAEIVD